MASSSNRKSNSWGSSSSKPTFRRAGASSRTPRPTASSRPSRPAAKPAAARPASSAAKAPAAGFFKKKQAPKQTAKPAAAYPSYQGGKRVAMPKVAAAPRPGAGGPKSLPQAASSVVPTSPRVAASAPKVAQPRKGKAYRVVAGSAPSPLKKQAGPKRPSPLAPLVRTLGGVFSAIPHPKLSRGVIAGIAGGIAAIALIAVVVVYSGLFAATDIEIHGSAHVSQESAQQLIDLPSGTTLLNVNESKIAENLKQNPWVSGVDITREFPHKLVITPHERTVVAIAYISADDIAWAIGNDSTWIAPMSLTVTVDAEGNVVSDGVTDVASGEASSEGEAVPEGATTLSGLDAALKLADQLGAELLVDVAADVNPSSGQSVTAKTVLAGLSYVNGFSREFLDQVKDISVSSVEAVSANLTSGVEVSLGSPEDISLKERAVTKLLAEQEGVTFVNVRTPGAYTYRSVPNT